MSEIPFYFVGLYIFDLFRGTLLMQKMCFTRTLLGFA